MNVNDKFVNFRNQIQKVDYPYYHHVAFADSTEDAKKICDELNKQHNAIKHFAEELRRRPMITPMAGEYNEGVLEILQRHYDYANRQSKKNFDNACAYMVYDLLKNTIRIIAKELGSEIK